jgi:hypothetical protein
MTVTIRRAHEIVTDLKRIGWDLSGWEAFLVDYSQGSADAAAEMLSPTLRPPADGCMRLSFPIESGSKTRHIEFDRVFSIRRVTETERHEITGLDGQRTAIAGLRYESVEIDAQIPAGIVLDVENLFNSRQVCEMDLVHDNVIVSGKVFITEWTDVRIFWQEYRTQFTLQSAGPMNIVDLTARRK